jgi:hypothetical protein
MHVGFASVVALSLSVGVGLGTTFALSKTWIGNDFLSDDWVWFTAADPTNGRVNYVSQAEALQEGLAYGVSFECLFLAIRGGQTCI